MGRYLLGVDIGTTNVKAVLFDLEGKVVAQKQSEYRTFFPNPGWAEQDPNEWWKAVVDTIRYITGKCIERKNEIMAVGVSCQAPTMLPLDKNGNPLRKAIIWMDRRSEKQCDLLRDIVGEDNIFKITGNRIDPFFVLPEILWFKDNEADLFKHTYKIIQPNGYINYKLTGNLTIDNVHASITQLYNVNNLEWSYELCDQLGISPDLLPEVYESTEIIGSVSSEAALSTGLAPGTPVIAGTVDGAAAALEAGVVGSGQAVEMTGTSSVLLIGSNKLRTNKNLTSMYHAVKNHYLILGTMSTTGASLKWFRDEFCFTEKIYAEKLGYSAYRLMDIEAENVSPQPTKIIFLPYMMGERSPIWDSYARGVFIGLNLNNKRGEIIRAIMEGSAFALYHNLEEAMKAGLTINELRAVGGGVNSELWLKIKASVMNKPVVVPETSVGAPLGDAILAGIGIGVYSDISKTIEKFVKFKKVIEPNLDWYSHYQNMYEIYRSTYRHLKNDLFELTK